MYSFLAKNIVYPLGDLALGTSVMKYYHWLQKSQWYSPEQLHEIQNSKLKNLISHIYNNVPYYKKLFMDYGLIPNDIKDMNDLNKLPILTKEIIRSHFDEFIPVNFKNYKPILNLTGGSTGEPLRYYITKDVASISWAGMYRGWGWAGYKFGDKRITFGGSSLVPNKKPSFLQLTRQRLERNLPLSVVSMNKEKYESCIAIIRKYKPIFLKGYPSSIYLLADYCMNNKINDIRFKAIFSTAEVLLPQYRELIQIQFNCKVYDQYGSYDGGGQALECEKHSGFHITVEKVIMEIVDENGSHVPPGQPGRIIVTDLHNYAMPFIRYDVGDIGVMDNEPCSCGRNLPMLKSIEGRTTDIIKFSNGICISGPAIVHLFRLQTHVKQYQVIQNAKDELLIKIVKAEGYSDIDTEIFMSVLKHHAGEGIEINLEFCDEIPTGSNSKYRFIISKVQPEVF
jgi:phenylacetate-CoA ligase